MLHDYEAHWELVARDLCSGIPDKNGAEIYKGDLVRLREADRLYYIDFVDGCFKLIHAEPELKGTVWGTIERVSDLLWTIEVVGNIYTDSELLQPK